MRKLFTRAVSLYLLNFTTLSVAAPLMTTPKDFATIWIENESQLVQFKWLESNRWSKYEFQLFKNENNSNPIYRKPLSGNNYQLRLKRFPKKIYWRVVGIDAKGNYSKNKDRFRITFVRSKKLQFRTSINSEITYLNSNVNHDLKKIVSKNLPQDLNYIGYRIGLLGRYVYHEKNPFLLGLDVSDVRDGSNNWKDFHLLSEAGWSFWKNQEATLGYQYTYTYAKLDVSKSKFSSHQAVASYRWWPQLSTKLSATIPISTFIDIQDYQASISTKPAINYQTSKDFYLNFFFLYERTRSNKDFNLNTSSQSVRIEQNNYGVGIGYTFAPRAASSL